MWVQLADSFNSLQTGKCIASIADAAADTTKLTKEFQFPSNGKVYSKQLSIKLREHANIWVSIPFKRESV